MSILTRLLIEILTLNFSYQFILIKLFSLPSLSHLRLIACGRIRYNITIGNGLRPSGKRK
jgi:hypothetical protein